MSDEANFDALEDQSRTNFQELFIHSAGDPAVVLTDLLNRLCFWEKIESEEELQRHNAAIEILETIGIGHPEDRESLIRIWLEYPINPLKMRRRNG